MQLNDTCYDSYLRDGGVCHTADEPAVLLKCQHPLHCRSCPESELAARQVVDVFAMPQSGTGVSVEAVDPVFQTKMLDMLKQTGRCVCLRVTNRWIRLRRLFRAVVRGILTQHLEGHRVPAVSGCRAVKCCHCW
jgi:hypothetical protein